MEDLKVQWLELEKRVEALTARERLYVLVVVIAVCWGGWDFLVNTPMAKDREQLKRSIADAEGQMAAANDQVRALLARRSVDPNAVIQQRLERLEKEMDELELRKQGVSASFLNARAMADLLRNLLKRQGGLELIGLETLPVQAVVKQVKGEKSEEAKPAPEGPMIYRHDLSIEFEGGYFDMLGYLQALESQQVFWDAAEFVVTKYPKARVRIQVYTLSFDKEWLGV